jgi:hypothetical protein
LKDTAEHALGENSRRFTTRPPELDVATIARFAEMVGITSAEGQAQFVADLPGLCKKALAWAVIKAAKAAKADAPRELTHRVWALKVQKGANRQLPAHRASPAFRERNADVARTGRQFIRALAARRAFDPSDPSSEGA